MSEYIKGSDVRKLQKGIKVERPASLLPQTGVLPIFNVLVGRVAITQIVGEVTVITAGLANGTTLEHNPAVAAGTTVPLCIALDTAGDEVGTLYGIEGDPAVALIGINAGGLPAQERNVILPIGTLDWRCLANDTGEVKWTIFYVPIDDGAYVTAA